MHHMLIILIKKLPFIKHESKFLDQVLMSEVGSTITFSVQQLGSQLWLMKRPKFPLAHASIT